MPTIHSPVQRVVVFQSICLWKPIVRRWNVRAAWNAVTTTYVVARFFGNPKLSGRVCLFFPSTAMNGMECLTDFDSLIISCSKSEGEKVERRKRAAQLKRLRYYTAVSAVCSGRHYVTTSLLVSIAPNSVPWCSRMHGIIC